MFPLLRTVAGVFSVLCAERRRWWGRASRNVLPPWNKLSCWFGIPRGVWFAVDGWSRGALRTGVGCFGCCVWWAFLVLMAVFGVEVGSRRWIGAV